MTLDDLTCEPDDAGVCMHCKDATYAVHSYCPVLISKLLPKPFERTTRFRLDLANMMPAIASRARSACSTASWSTSAS